jgi:hypothetical protein
VAVFLAGPVWKRALMLVGVTALVVLVVFLAIQLQTDVQLVDLP